MGTGNSGKDIKMYDMLNIAKSLGFNMDFGRVLSNEINQVYKDFDEWLDQYYEEEIDEIKAKLNNQIDARQGNKPNLVLEENYCYIDMDLDSIIANVVFIDFNDILKLTKRIVRDLELDSIVTIETNFELKKDTLDSINTLISSLYKVFETYAADTLKEKLYLYIPDLTSWLISQNNSVLIYSVVSELMQNTRIVFCEPERNSLYERIASNQGKRIHRKYSIDFEDFGTNLILKIMTTLKQEFKLGEMYQWFEPLNNNIEALRLGTIKNTNSEKEKDILNPTVWKMLVKEYSDWLEKRNTNPTELANLRKDLVRLQAFTNLFNENKFDDQIKDLEQAIDAFQIKLVSVSPETFFEYLNTQKFEINITSVEKDRAQIEKTIQDFDRLFKDRIKGQDQVIKPFWDILKKWYVGIRNNKPIGSFLLCGPTGVGKTETAKLLADSTFGTLITLDMSEYQTEIDATKIIGVAPGYAGYDQGAGILDKIAANPRSIILFDEIEKAHYKIFDLLLQVLDEGRLTDHKGNIVSFSECLIICTTNAHYSEIEHLGHKERGQMVNILCESFRKEFLARFNDIIKYNPLSDETMLTIFDMKMEKELKELSDASQTEVSIIEDENYYSAKSNLINLMDNDLGARELGRIINQDFISKMIHTIIELGQDNKKEKTVFYFDTMRELHLWEDAEQK